MYAPIGHFAGLGWPRHKSRMSPREVRQSHSAQSVVGTVRADNFQNLAEQRKRITQGFHWGEGTIF
jgi:hypothetical protein